jgi:ribulose-phosphate 3-epimerase
MTHYAQALDFPRSAIGVVNKPMTANQLCADFPSVGYGHGVGKRKLICIWVRLVFEKLRFYANVHAVLEHIALKCAEIFSLNYKCKGVLKTMRLAPSILSADFARLGEEVRAVEAAGADLIHFDVMDNHYVPNLTIGPLVCEAIRPHVKIPIDVHLMVSPVDRIIPDFAKAGANIITFHPDASTHVDRTLSLIRELGCKAGLVLNPATPLNCLDYVLDKVDMILLMSVNPGFGGQKFIPATLTKCRQVRQLINAHVAAGGQPISLEIDGGVKVDNIAQIAAAGADTFVAGSAVFSARDADGGYKTVFQQFRQALAAAKIA